MCNIHTENFNNLPKIPRPICSAKVVGWSRQVECHTKVFACHWRLPFGEVVFCVHAANAQIAEGHLVSGWVLTMPKTAAKKSVGNLSLASSRE
jgi:hypothetical protein